MAIATTATFNPDTGDLIEEAFELAGFEIRTGFDLHTARRSLNMLIIEWQNRGLNLWTIDEQKISEDSDGTALTTNYLNKSTASYNLALGTISLLDVVLRINDANASTQQDYLLSRVSEPTYAAFPNKLALGRPVQYYFQRTEILNTGASTDTNSTISLWPVPDKNTEYKIVYWRMKRLADVGVDGSNTMEIPSRFLPALTMGLAVKIAMKKKAPPTTIQMLNGQYQGILTEAMEEDRDKTSLRLVPRVYH